MKKNIKLSIIIVDYKSGEHLERLVSAIPKMKEWEVIVINNNIDNIGYGAGCNNGALRSKGEYLLFLNPDVLPHKQAIERMVSYLEKHTKVVAVGPKFINAQGLTEQTSTMFPTKKDIFVAHSFLNTFLPNNPISRTYWMKDWNRESTKEVEVLSGAVLMVRADAFQKVDGFDEQFFLYWEEFDLCKRLSGLGKPLVYLSDAVFDHVKGVSMSASDNDANDTSEHFVHSRMLFLEKYFGFFFTFLPQTWFFVTEQWRALLVFAIAFFFRSWNLKYITMIGDLGRDYLQALDMVQAKNLPMMGIPSSVPRLLQGPFNIWFDAVSFLLGGVSPYSPVLFAALLTSAGILFFYLFLQKAVSKQVALPLALLAATSPAAVAQSRMPFYTFAIPFFLILFLKKMLQLDPKKTTTIFWFVLSGWLLFQWELATIPLLILVPIAVWRMHLKKSHVFAGVLATIVGLMPQIVYDITHRCAQLCSVAAWTGYRLVAWTGFDGRHVWTVDKGMKLLSLWRTLLSSMFGGRFELYGVLIILIVGILFVYKKYKKLPFLFSVCIVAIISMSVGVILHGEPSEAYMPPFLILLLVMLGYGLISFPAMIRKVCLIALFLLVTKNGLLLVRTHYGSKDLSPYIEATQWIVRDAAGQEIRLKSYDSPAVFPTYLDHYRFLIRAIGGNLNEKGKRYIIVAEDGVIVPSIHVEKRIFGPVTVIKDLQ